MQADPIRTPARAQDLILRHRVKGYRAGDLERRYESLGIEEDFFVNYGYVTRAVQALMHPRLDLRVPADGNDAVSAAERKREKMLLDFVAERGAVHLREVEEHFAHGTVRNYWGGSSHATTQMLDALHYRGKLRVARREKGIRIYRTHRHEPGPLEEAACRARIDALVDVAVNLYAPLPGASLSYYVRRLRYACELRVELARDAKKEFARLPASVQKRVARVLLSPEENPFPTGCKKLKNRDGWRVRVGDYRILYLADKEARQVIVGVIRNRKDVNRR